MNKKIFFLVLVFSIFSGIFLIFDLAKADCCLNTCTPSSGGVCSGGSTPAPGDCSSFPACSSSAGSVTFENPIGFETVAELLDSVLSSLMGVIVIISVIFIVIGGIMYITSAGNETMIGRAKKTITGATVGLAISLASPIFLKQIQEILGGTGVTGSAQQWVDDAISVKQVAVNVLDFLLSIFGIIAIISLVIGGAMYLTAYGDEKKIDTGKKIFKFSVIGIAIALGSLVIVKQIAKLLEIS